MRYFKYGIIIVSLFIMLLFNSCQPEETFTIRFDTNGGTPVKSIFIEENNSFCLPGFSDIFFSDVIIETLSIPEQTNYKVDFKFEDESLKMPTYKYNAWFDGWYTDQQLTNKFDANKKIDQSMTLYAKWIEVPNPYDIYNNLEFKLSDDRTYYIITKITETSIPITVIPSKYNDLPVRSISGANSLKSSILLFEDNSNVEYIEENAFKGSLLEFVQLPRSLKELKSCSFEDCKMLQFIDFMLDSNLANIGNNTFSNCTKLDHVIIPSEIESIGDEAFKNCSNLTNIYMYRRCELLNNIGKYAFESCSSLKQIAIPRSVKIINEGTFYNCTSLEKVVYYNYRGLDVGDRAFYECKRLKHIDLDSPCKYIGKESFYNCTSLSSIYIGDSVKEIGHNAFYNCTNLNTLYTRLNDTGWYRYYLYYLSKIEGETSPLYYVKKVYVRNEDGETKLFNEDDVNKNLI